MDKAFILSEIKRTAADNDDKALGVDRFAKETGINPYAWGAYWDTWSDALKESGFSPNQFARNHSHETLISSLISLIRELGQFPLRRQLIKKRRNDPEFPNERSFYKLGNKMQTASKVLEYCQTHPGFDDVAKICSAIAINEKSVKDERSDQNSAQTGYVYLWKSHKRYKIGKSFDLKRREGELAPQSPYAWKRIHEIKTDDPSGVEAYWHRRFTSKNTERSEWFELSSEDVKAFKRWRNIY